MDPTTTQLIVCFTCGAIFATAMFHCLRGWV